MKKFIPTLVLASLIFFSACKKNDTVAPPPDPNYTCTT